MKVVINACYGGFNLSDEAVEYCISKGMTCTVTNKGGGLKDQNADFVKWNNRKTRRYSARQDHPNAFRCNPIVVEAVEKLGDKANGQCAKLKVIDIPFQDENGWVIDEYDGFEQIEEEHRTWG